MSEIFVKGIWLIIILIYGVGEYLDNIQFFIQVLQNILLNIFVLCYVVVVIGDLSYDIFCVVGKYVYQLLGDIGVKFLVNCFIIDV